MQTKICTNCECDQFGNPQLLINFNKSGARHQYGVTPYCKECVTKKNKEYYIKTQEKQKEEKKLYYQENQEHLKIQKMEYLNSPAKYLTYKDKINLYENTRSNDIFLEVQCKNSNCQKWFIPTNDQVQHRLKAINGTQRGESNFYCSDGCKDTCSIYGMRGSINSTKNTTREMQSQLRELVLIRDEYKCIKCGNTEDLICHHIDPVVNNPIESADVSNCITICKYCHKLLHQIPGCNNLQCYA